MRILFTFIGGLGHFLPMEPVARAAAAAGHEVAVACSGGLVEEVEAAGITAFATSAPRVGAPGSTRRDLTPLTEVDRGATEVEFAENFAGKGARRHATAVQEHLRAWRPDVVVRDEADFGSAVAAEVLGIPAATVLVLAAGTLLRPELVAPHLAQLRADHGLPPDPELGMVTSGPSSRRSHRRSESPFTGLPTRSIPSLQTLASRRADALTTEAARLRDPRDGLQLRLG